VGFPDRVSRLRSGIFAFMGILNNTGLNIHVRRMEAGADDVRQTRRNR
jgi:hypothetical protein